MKSPWLAGFMFAIAWPLSAVQAKAAQVGCDAYLGAWEYVAPTPPGRFIMAKHGGNKYLILWIAKDAPGETTGEFKVGRHEGVNAGAWEAACEGSRLRWRVLFAVDPAQVGKEYVQEGEVTGDNIKFWTVGPDGKPQGIGAARRLK
jgi:hypothetical protein